MGEKRRADRKKLRTREHVIADLSVNHVEWHILRCGFSVERIEHDYGIDLSMFTYSEKGELENGDVSLQLKATDKPRFLKTRKDISIAISYRDVINLDLELRPVILVVYEAQNDQAFWLYVQRYLQSPEGRSRLVNDGRENVTFHIPVANKLDEKAIELFRSFKQRIIDQAKGVIRHDA